jgi:hypothetical protein
VEIGGRRDLFGRTGVGFLDLWNYVYTKTSIITKKPYSEDIKIPLFKKKIDCDAVNPVEERLATSRLSLWLASAEIIEMRS